MMTFDDDFQGKYSSVGCVVFQPDPHHCLFHHLHPAHPDCHHCHHDHHCHEWERTFLARAFTSLPVEAIDLLVADPGTQTGWTTNYSGSSGVHPVGWGVYPVQMSIFWPNYWLCVSTNSILWCISGSSSKSKRAKSYLSTSRHLHKATPTMFLLSKMNPVYVHLQFCLVILSNITCSGSSSESKPPHISDWRRYSV